MVKSKTLIDLSCGDLYVQVAPEMGAAITQFYSLSQAQRYDWLRPASVQAIQEGKINEMASFLMAPWAGRIKEGRFHYQGKNIHYPSQDSSTEHSIHGFVRDRVWQVLSQQITDDVSELVLGFEHKADQAWPFSFFIVQSFLLQQESLRITVKAKNIGEQEMPFSLGHHPFFPANPLTTVQASVQGAWSIDEALNPLSIESHPATQALAHGLSVQHYELDTIFTAWTHEATVLWPEQHRRLRFSVDKHMDFFVVYSPAGQPWFCAEPFGNITNSINVRERFDRRLIGGMDLAAGESMAATFALYPRFEKT